MKGCLACQYHNIETILHYELLALNDQDFLIPISLSSKEGSFGKFDKKVMNLLEYLLKKSTQGGKI